MNEQLNETNELPEHIRDFIKKTLKGYNISGLAKKSHLDRGTIYRLLNGRHTKAYSHNIQELKDSLIRLRVEINKLDLS